MDQLEEIDQEITKNWLSQIKSNSWQKQREPHPNSILHRTGGICEEFGIDVINDYHAFCKPCLEHIYSNTNPSDPQSFVFRHANSEKHKFLLKSHRKTDIFIDKNDSIYCSVCNCDLQKSHFTQFESLDVRIKNHAMSSSHRDNAFLWTDGNMCIMVSIAHSVPFMTYLKDGSCGICFVSVKNKAEHVEAYCHLLTLAKYLQTCFYLSVEQLQNEESLTYLMVEMIKWMRDSGMDPEMETQADTDEVPAGEAEYLECQSVIKPENVPPERQEDDKRSQLKKAIDILSHLMNSYEEAAEKHRSLSTEKIIPKGTVSSTTVVALGPHSSGQLPKNAPSKSLNGPKDCNGNAKSSKDSKVKSGSISSSSGLPKTKPVKNLSPVPKVVGTTPTPKVSGSQPSQPPAAAEVKIRKPLIDSDTWLKESIGCGLGGGLTQVPHPQLMTRKLSHEEMFLAIDHFPKFMDVLSYYHAFCVACGVHLYGLAKYKDFKKDFFAHYTVHYNSPEHLRNETLFDSVQDMFVMEKDTFRCLACRVDVVKDDFHTMQPLADLINCHTKLSGHQENCVLMRDYLKDWISDNLSYFAGLDAAKSGQMKKDAEKTLQMLDTAKETKTASSGTMKNAREKLQNPQVLPNGVCKSPSETKIDCTPKSKSTWKVPVPQMVAHRNNGTSVQNLRVKFRQKHLDFVNGSHAYCAICDLHIYSAISVHDIYSQYASHVNDELHVALLRHMVASEELSPDQPLLKEIIPRKSAFCEVCQQDLKADGPRRPAKSLQEDVTAHLLLKH